MADGSAVPVADGCVGAVCVAASVLVCMAVVVCLSACMAVAVCLSACMAVADGSGGVVAVAVQAFPEGGSGIAREVFWVGRLVSEGRSRGGSSGPPGSKGSWGGSSRKMGSVEAFYVVKKMFSLYLTCRAYSIVCR